MRALLPWCLVAADEPHKVHLQLALLLLHSCCTLCWPSLVGMLAFFGGHAGLLLVGMLPEHWTVHWRLSVCNAKIMQNPSD
jgi:hypothetical protein